MGFGDGPIVLERFVCFCGSTEWEPLWASWGWAILCKRCSLVFHEKYYNADAVDLGRKGFISLDAPSGAVEEGHTEERFALKTCLICQRECKGEVGLQAHMRGAHP